MSTYNGDVFEFFKLASGAIRRVAVREVGASLGVTSHIVGVSGQYAIIHAHVFKSRSKVDVEIYQKLNPEVGEHGFKITLDRSMCVPVALDILLFNTRGLHFPNMVKHFAKGDFTYGSGVFNGQEVRIFRSNTPQEIKDDDPGSTYVSNDHFVYSAKHAPGMCGRLLVGQVDKNGAAILGVHSGGAIHEDFGYATPITQQMLLDSIRFYEESLAGPMMPVMAQGGLETLFMPTRKSPLRYIQLHNVFCAGRTLDPVLIDKKSKLENTPYVHEVDEFLEEEFGFTTTEQMNKPMMKPQWVDGVYRDPYIVGLQKMNVPAPYLDYEIMCLVVDKLIDHIVEGLRKKGVKQLAPISFLEAVNGVEGDPFIKRINASTSGAYGYPGVKAKYMPLNTDGVTREPTEELRSDILKLINQYRNQETASPFFSAQLKDEPREQSKCDTAATRLFYMSPLHHLILNRMYLSPFYSLMVSNADVFCAAIGTNMHSDSNDLARTLYQFAEKFLEGDYSGFDLSNSGYIAWMWSSVVYGVLKAFGYNDLALKIVQGLMSDAIFPFIIMNSDVFCKFGMVMSGKYATAEDNTGRGLCMLMFAWYSNPLLRELDFFEHCLPLLYGDDFLVGIKKESEEKILPLFNNLTYQGDCLRYFNMKITPAKKNNELSLFMNFFDTSFLKRTFKHSELYDRFIAPLDMNSIRKSLMWYLPSDAVTREHQTVASLSSSLWELFFHCKSRDQFERVRNYYCGLLQRYFGNGDGHILLPTYVKIGTTTRCLDAELEDSENFYPAGDGSTVSSVHVEELNAFKDSLIPAPNLDDEFNPDFQVNSQHNILNY
jgi:hypothetical protein